MQSSRSNKEQYEKNGRLRKTTQRRATKVKDTVSMDTKLAGVHKPTHLDPYFLRPHTVRVSCQNHREVFL
jgi:hypothetical protein